MTRAKRIIIVPVIVFLAGMILLVSIVQLTESNERKQNSTKARLNAITYAERMKNDIANGIGITDTLQQILISENGVINQFDKVAKDMMNDTVQSIQIAPGGVVTDIYPAKGNEAGKIDLINDKDRGEISRYARDNRITVMQGPFVLKQGGFGIAVRNPVYLEDDKGDEYFWGFAIVILKVPDVFADSVKALSDFGYEYKLSKTETPWEDEYMEVYKSGAELYNPVSYDFEIGGEQWKLEVMPANGWLGNYYLLILVGAGIIIVLLLTGLTVALLVLDRHKNDLRQIALTDALTGIYNRHGFDENVAAQMRQNPDGNCIAAQFDVDDFKIINDMYGHDSGDRALQSLAKSMRDYFPQNAILGRNGGDEFCIFLPDCDGITADRMMHEFAKQPKSFIYNGEEHKFSISLGYAQYPLYAKNRDELMRCADAALYEVKLRGKNGCMAYSDDIRLEMRKQLGFALNDISENLPGAFIIYKADKKDDEIYYANREFVRMTGCENLDEMIAYTDGSFGKLIRDDERDSIEESIWSQIDSGNSNDYIHFHMRRADGTYIQVLDHGRIVDSIRYGRVFYVLIMDWESMQKHYSDKF